MINLCLAAARALGWKMRVADVLRADYQKDAWVREGTDEVLNVDWEAYGYRVGKRRYAVNGTAEEAPGKQVLFVSRQSSDEDKLDNHGQLCVLLED